MATTTEEVKIRFSAETNTQSFKNLQNELDKIQEAWAKLNNKSTNPMAKQMQEAAVQAGKLETAMAAAYNPKLNTYNLDVLKQKLVASNTSLNQVINSFNSIGARGTSAILSTVNGLTSMNLQLNKTETLIDKIGSNMLKSFQWTIYSSISNTILNTVRESVGYVEALDSSLNDIRIVTGKSADEMDRFAQIANKAAQSLGQGTKDYTNASLIYYQQGLSDEDVKTRTDITVKAANVTQQSTAEVSEQLTAVWNGYKVSSQEAELYVDKLAKVAASTAADLEELSTGMSKVASAANTVGVDVDKMNAILATTISVTKQSPETVGVAYKTILARMTSIQAGETAEDGATLASYTEKMAGFGINVLDANNRLREMGEVIEEVGTKWQSMGREQKIALAQVMAGTRQYNNLMALFENWDMYEDALRESANAAGTLNEQQDIYMESTAAHLQQMRTAAEGVYDSLLDAKTINNFADSLTKILQVIEKLTDGLGGLEGILSILTPVAMQLFSKTISSNLGETFSNLQAAQFNQNQIQQRFQNVENLRNSFTSQGFQLPPEVEDVLSKREQLVKIAPSLNHAQIQEASQLIDSYAGELSKILTTRQSLIEQSKQTKQAGKEEIAVIDEQKIATDEYLTELRKLRSTADAYGQMYGDLAAIKNDNPLDVSKLITYQQADYNNAIYTTLKNAGVTQPTAQQQSQITKSIKDIVDSFYAEYTQEFNKNSPDFSRFNVGKFLIDKMFEIPEVKNDTNPARKAAIEKYLTDTAQAIYSDITKNSPNILKEIADQQKANKNFADNFIQNIFTPTNDPEASFSPEFKQKINDYKQKIEQILTMDDKPVEQIQAFETLKQEIADYVATLPEGSEEADRLHKITQELEKTNQQATEGTINLEQMGDALKRFNLSATINTIAKGAGAITGLATSSAALGKNIQSGNIAGIFASVSTAAYSASNAIPIATAALKTFGVEAGMAATAAAPIVLIIMAIIAALSGLSQHEEKEAELAKERAKEEKQLYEEEKTHYEQIKTLVESYKDLNNQYSDGSITLDDLRQKTHDLLVEYDMLDEAVQSLTASEEQLNKMMDEASKKAYEDLAEQAKKAQEAASYSGQKNIGKDFFENVYNFMIGRDSYNDKIVANSAKTSAMEEELKNLGFEYVYTDPISLNVSSMDLTDPEKARALVEWVNDATNKTKFYYKEMETLYRDNKEYIDEIISVTDDYINNSAEAFALSMGTDFTDFSDFSQNREAFIEFMKTLLPEDEAEKYVHDFFLKLSETTAFEAKNFLLNLVADSGAKELLEGLTDEEILMIYNQYQSGLMEGLTTESIEKAKNTLNTSVKVSRLDEGSRLTQGVMETSYLDMEEATTLFNSNSFKQYIEDTKSAIKDVEDYEKASINERKALINGYYKYTVEQANLNKSENIQIMQDEIDRLNKIVEKGSVEDTSSARAALVDTLKAADKDDNTINSIISDLEKNQNPNSVITIGGASSAAADYLEQFNNLNAAKNAQDQIDALTGSIKQLNEAAEGRQFDSYKKQLDSLFGGESAKQVQDWQQTLQKAQQEYEKTGTVTLETWRKLKEEVPSVYETLFMKDGKLNFDTVGISNMVADTILETAKETLDEVNKGFEAEIANKENEIEKAKKHRDSLDNPERGAAAKTDVDKENENIAILEADLKNLREEQKRTNDEFLVFKDIISSIGSEIEQFSLSDFNKSVSVIEAAKKEQEQYGQVSSDTIEKLIALGVDYANCWEIVNGQLVINQEEIEKVKQKKYDAYVEEMTEKKAELEAEIALTKAAMIRASISGTISADLIEKLNTAKADLKNVIKALKNAENILNAPNSFGSSGSAKTYTAIESREFHADTSVYDTQIKALQEDLNILRSEAEYLSGEDLNKNLEEQKAIMEEIVSLQSEKLSLSQQEQEVIKKDIEDLTGIKVETDKHGFITNLNALTGSYQSEMKAAADKYNNMITPYGENGVTNAATQKEIEAAKKDYESKKKRYDTLQTYIKEYNTAVSSGKEAEKEIIKIANDEILSQETQRYEAESREIKKMADTYNIAAGSFDKFEKQWSKMSFDERIQSIDEYNKKMEESITLQKQYTENMGKRLTEVLNNGTVDISKITEGLWNGDLTDMSEGAANIYTDYINRRIKELETATDRYEDLSTAEGQEYHSLLLLKDLLVPYAENLEEVNEKTKDLTVSSQTLADAADKYATTSIDRQIEKAEKELARVKKQESGLKGNALIANLAKQNSLIQKQIELEKKKLTIIKAQLSMQVQQANTLLKSLLENTGITLSLNEDLSNVTEITNALKNMDNLSAESYKLYSEALDKALATYSTYQSIQSEIESLTDEIADNAKKAAEKIKEELAKAFNAKVDVEVNIEDAWRNLHKLRAELDGLKDDDYFGNMNLQLKQLTEYLNTNPNSTLPGGSTQILTQHLQDIMSEIRTMQGGGTSKIYGTDQSAAFSDLQNYRDQLGSNVQSMMDSVKEMKQTYLSAIDAMISANDKFIQSIDKMSSILNNTMNIVKLVYGDDSYKKMDKYLRMSAQLAMNSATAARNNADNYRARMLSSTTEEEYRKWADAWTGAIDDVYSHAESAIKALQTLVENNVKQATAKITDQWKQIGENGLPLSVSWDLEKDKIKDFYDYTNSMYQRDSLSRKIQKAIDEATDPTTINALQDAYANIIGYLDESIDKNKKLSKYEVERANKLYDLTLKQMALEDERDNKTKMRLRRDQAGNYRYEYVADDSKVAQSEEEVEKIKNELYNQARDRATSASDNINSLSATLQEKLLKLGQEYQDPAQYQEAATKLIKEYQGLIEDNQRDIKLAIETAKKYGLEPDSEFIKLATAASNFTGMTEEDIARLIGDNTNLYEMLKSMGLDVTEMSEGDMGTAQDISEYYGQYAADLETQVNQTKMIVDQLEAMKPILDSIASTALAAYEQSLLLREQEVDAITGADGTNTSGSSGPNLVASNRATAGGTISYYYDPDSGRVFMNNEDKNNEAGRKKLEAMYGVGNVMTDKEWSEWGQQNGVVVGGFTRQKRTDSYNEVRNKNGLVESSAALAEAKAIESANRRAEIYNKTINAAAVEAAKKGGATAGIFQELQGIGQMLAEPQPLEQHVTIEAQFQGKTKETEIFEALKGLVNRAAQVAENNGK